MTTAIAHLGPPGTYTEQATLAYVDLVQQKSGVEAILCPYPNISQTLRAVAQGDAQLAVVPVENSIEGGVTMTLDTLWQLDNLQIHLALVMPIAHSLMSYAQDLAGIKTVYSHPQALAQCQGWLEQFLPQVQLIPANSTTETLQLLVNDPTLAAIASQRAAQIYHLPVLASRINDHPENCTRFWVIGRGASVIPTNGTHTSLAFSTRANIPGALVRPLQVFADLGINLSRIESRPTKRSLGDYLFFIDLEASDSPRMQAALEKLTAHTEILKIFGNYQVVPISVLTDI
jgi:prephenate dehydratase